MLHSCASRLIAIGALAAGFAPHAEAAPKTMNAYVEQVVKDFAAHRAMGGYDIGKAFTQDLDYGSDAGAIKATDHVAASPKPTMCVAASAEVIVEALNLYARENADPSAFKKLPLMSWTRGNITSIKANIFMFAGTGSRGTGHTLQKFGIGKEKTFADLNPYDFVNLNRQKSGHAVVFINYLGKNYESLPAYSADVMGFKYFSAQGKGKPDAGFAYRYAYFDPYCPDAKPGMPRDCGIIKSLSNKALLDGGELWEPSEWDTDKAQKEIAAGVKRSIESQYQGAPRGLVDSLVNQSMEQELVFQPDRLLGETTD